MVAMNAISPTITPPIRYGVTFWPCSNLMNVKPAVIKASISAINVFKAVPVIVIRVESA